MTETPPPKKPKNKCQILTPQELEEFFPEKLPKGLENLVSEFSVHSMMNIWILFTRLHAIVN